MGRMEKQDGSGRGMVCGWLIFMCTEGVLFSV